MESYHSGEAFRYVWINWRIMGLHPFARYKTLYKIYAVFITIASPIIPPLQQMAQLLFVDTIADVMRNLSVSLEWSTGCLKHLIIAKWHKSLLASHTFLIPLDARVLRNADELIFMKGIVKDCHRLYVLYNVFFWSTVGFYMGNGAIYHRLLFEAYMPWDWQASTNKYLLAVAYQWTIAGFQGVLNLASDFYAVGYLHMMNGHLKALAMRISRIGYKRDANEDENYDELVKCVQDHWNILRYFEHIRPVISRTILVQFVVTAFALCLAAFYFVTFNSNIAMLLSTLLYVGLLLAEILPCCYSVNNLIIASEELTLALYSCNWMDQSPKFRKAVIIFMQRTQKTSTIMAGNLVPITVQTCLKIIRFSFSMFTILTQM